MDEKKSWAAPDNVTTVLENFNNLVKYSKELEATVECYENSLKK